MSVDAKRKSVLDLADPVDLSLVWMDSTCAKLDIHYKARWQVELFFNWVKQPLHIKSFFGTSENEVKTQVWIAMSVYVLISGMLGSRRGSNPP